MRLAPLLVLLAGCAAPPPAPDPGPRYKGEPLSHWLEEIKDLSPSRIEDAATALKYFGEAAAPAIPDLVRGLRYDSCQDEISDALEAIGPSALPAVLEAMTAPELLIRRGAAYTLAGFVEGGARGPEILAALGRGLDDPDGAARMAALAIRYFGAEAAPFIPRLEALAAGESRGGRYAEETLEILRGVK